MLTDTPVDGWVSGLAFTPDGSQIIGTGSCDGAGDSFEAYLTDWNLADADRPGPLQTSSRSGVALAFSPDGRQMAVGESSGPDSTVKSRVRIWSLDPARVLATVPKLVGAVYSVAYSNDGLWPSAPATRRNVCRVRCKSWSLRPGPCGRSCPTCPARLRPSSASTAAL